MIKKFKDKYGKPWTVIIDGTEEEWEEVQNDPKLAKYKDRVKVEKDKRIASGKIKTKRTD